MGQYTEETIKSIISSSIDWVDIIFKIALCVAIFFVGKIFFRLLKKSINKIFKTKSGNNANEKKINTLSKFVLSFAKYGIYFVIFYLVCKALGFQVDSLFIAVAGTGTVALGLGSQTLIKDVINGFFILVEDQYAIGDYVEIRSLIGIVEEVGIRTTKVRAFDGALHIIPNGEITLVTNKSKEFSRAIVDINISYESNADKTIDLLDNLCKNNLNGIDGIKNIPEVLGVNSFEQSYYTIRILAECEPNKNWQAEREIRRIVKNTLDAENINFPHTSLRFINRSE